MSEKWVALGEVVETMHEAVHGPGPRTEDLKERVREIRYEQSGSPSNLAYLAARQEWRLKRVEALLRHLREEGATP